MKEQWRKDMRHKLADYRKAAPEISWSEVEKAVAEHHAAQRHTARVIPLWQRRIAAAAAVILVISGIGYISISQRHSSDKNTVAETSQSSSMIKKQIAVTEKEHTKTRDIIEKIVADICPGRHRNATSTMLAEAARCYDPAITIAETSNSVSTPNQDKVTEARKEVARQHFHSDRNDTFHEQERKPASELSAGVFMSNTVSGYNNTGNGGMVLAAADPFGTYDNAFAANDAEMIQNKNSNTETTTHHRQPIRVGVRIRYSLDKRWSVESGLTYSYLASEINHENGACTYNTDQKLHYVGIPVNVNYNIITTKRLNIYASGGGMAEKMVNGKASTKYSVDNKLQSTTSENVKINPLQWSANASVGLEYNIDNNIGVYIEPGASYYIANSSPVQTIYKDKPFNINLNVGLRINIK